MKTRLDLFLVQTKQVPSRTRAQDLIRNGSVWIFENSNWQAARSPSQSIEDGTQVEIRDNALQRYVSRGGLKLEGALQHTGIAIQNLEVLDVGMSTGGFTDCLLQHGASQVVGIDVGHAQLHSQLQGSEKVISLEGVNARDLDQNSQVQKLKPLAGWPLIVVDVSFISLSLVLPALEKVLASDGQILALVKPQFEVGPEGLGKGGVVKDESLYKEVEQKIRQKCLELKMNVRDYFTSSIEGKDGNREFFIWIQKN